jgi:hypothetical protein
MSEYGAKAMARLIAICMEVLTFKAIYNDGGETNLDASGAVVITLPCPRHFTSRKLRMRKMKSMWGHRDLQSQSQNTGSPRISCATILASELDLSETALRYPSYAAFLLEILEASIARLTAAESS